MFGVISTLSYLLPWLMNSLSTGLKQQADMSPALGKRLQSRLLPPLFLGSFFPPSLAPQLTHLPSASYTLTGCLVFPSPPLSLALFLSSLSLSH